jgi:hypothetical protein
LGVALVQAAGIAEVDGLGKRIQKGDVDYESIFQVLDGGGYFWSCIGGRVLIGKQVSGRNGKCPVRA